MELTTSYQKLGEKYLGSSYGDLYIRIYAKYSEQDISNNTTKVQYQARAYFSGNYILDQQSSGNVKGTSASQVNFSRSSNYARGETTLGTTEAWVTHNNDGTMSISASAYLNFPNWGWNGTASGTATLPNLHKPPVINTATMVETNSVLTALNVPNTTIVRYLSKKTITLNGTAYDGATLTYRLRHLNIDYAIPSSSTYQNSNVFNTDYTTHDVAIGDGKANLIQDIKDSYNAEATDWVYVNINGTTQKPNGIAYTKPTIERTTTSIKRKSGGGTTLTDNKAVLNFKGTFYKGNDVIGNNNNIQQIGYKLWEKGTTEPSNYTPLTPTISGGDISVTNLELSNLIYTKTYNYKIILKDNYDYQDAILDGTLPTGQSVWTEYKDRVDFLALTVKGENPFALIRESVFTFKKWVYLCNITFTEHMQGAFTTIRIYIGKGNNGEPNQNAYIDLSMQMGWEGSNDGRFGCLAELNKCLTSFTLENIKLKIIANDNHNYDIYFYESLEDYCAPNYIVLSNDKATITPKNQVLNSEPIGTECNIRYMYASNEVYDTSEGIIGTWLNKPLYRKVINVGSLPNNSTIRVNHNISNLGQFTKIDGVAVRSSDNDTLPIPYATFNANNSGGITIYVDNTSVVIRTTTDRSSYNGYVVLEYTKTID